MHHEWVKYNANIVWLCIYIIKPCPQNSIYYVKPLGSHNTVQWIQYSNWYSNLRIGLFFWPASITWFELGMLFSLYNKETTGQNGNIYFIWVRVNTCVRRKKVAELVEEATCSDNKKQKQIMFSAVFISS